MGLQVIAHYRITGALGKGGMGEVYRATDTKLGRDVAVKVVPEIFARDADRLARFTREAHILASLNHPNVAAIYGVEHGALVMELVEGSTLAECIRNGPIPIEEALPIVRQIADALEYAHGRGIIHRDLKPANVIITPEGRAKVLDFGLAKALATAPAPAALASSPTMTAEGTLAGVVMGTSPYMSPEQARGVEVDRRTDIWAFGAVIYEMLTGRRAFAGETTSDTVAAVLKADPDWSALPPRTPLPVRRLLRRCLERDRKRRLADIADARLEIDDAASSAASELPVPGIGPRGRFKSLAFAVAVAAVALLALAALRWFALRSSASPSRPGVAFSVTMPQGTRMDPDPYAPNAAVSPDGTAVALVALSESGSDIWVRSLSSEVSRRIPGSEGASALFWSPDGKEIGFFSADKLKKVSLAGGAVSVLCEAKQTSGAAWNRDGLILFSDGNAMQSVSASGGAPQTILPVDVQRGEMRHGWPSFLPDGRRFVYFSVNRDPEQHAIMLASLDDRRPRVLFRNTGKADFGSPGHLIFARDGVLYAQAWDFDAARPRSDARIILPGVNTAAVGRAAFNVSGGALVYRTGAVTRTQLVSYGRDGRPVRNIGPPGPYVQVTLSPDEKMAAFHSARTQFRSPQRLWLMRLDSEVVSRYDFGRSANADPVWSPDSRQIAFAVFDLLASWPSDIMVWTVGDQSPRLLLSDGKKNKPDDWTPDGKFVLCRRNDQTAFLMPLAPGGHPIDVGDSATPKDQMRISPDGRFVAYNTTKDRPEVFVARFPSMTDAMQVSAAGGVQPIWTRRGKELIYAAIDGQLMSVEIRSSSGFEISAPRPLFRASTPFSVWLGQYAVSADGRRFYLLEPSGVSPDAWHVLTKWQDAGAP